MAEPNGNGSDNLDGNGAGNPDEKIMAIVEKIIADKMGQVVNAAVTNHMKRVTGQLEEKFGKSLDEKLGGLMSAFDTQLKASLPELLKGLQPQPSDDEPGGKGGKKGKPEEPRVDPKVAEMEKQLQSLTARLEQEAKEREAERKMAAEAQRRALEDRGFAEFKAGLAGKVLNGREEDLATLVRAKGMFTLDENGQPRIKVVEKNKYTQQDEEQFLDLNEGLKTLLAKDFAQVYLPPPAPGGAGGNGGQRQQKPANPGARPAPPATGGDGFDRAIAALEAQGGGI